MRHDFSITKIFPYSQILWGTPWGGTERSDGGFAGRQGSGHPLSPPQIGHRDFDVEKRLRRDLRRTRALLADVQLLLAAPGEPSASTQELERLRKKVGAVRRAGISLLLGASSPFTSAEGKLQEIFADRVLIVCGASGDPVLYEHRDAQARVRSASCAEDGLPVRSTSL